MTDHKDSISYLIGTHNEGLSLDTLLQTIINEKNEYDEVIVVDDYSDDELTLNILEKYKNLIQIHKHKLDNNFAKHKNFMNSLCIKNYIFNIDADESVSKELIRNIQTILLCNQETDLLLIPRINIVNGLTINHVNKWNWKISKFTDITEIKDILIDSDEYNLLKTNNLIISEKIISDTTLNINTYIPIVNFPDYQGRIYLNRKHLYWEGKVHEKIVGYGDYALLPFEVNYSLFHIKDISIQEKQNDFYNNL